MGTYSYVNPVVAVIVGWLAGEIIDGWVVAGITTILLGVFLVRRRRTAFLEGKRVGHSRGTGSSAARTRHQAGTVAGQHAFPRQPFREASGAWRSK